MKANSVDAMQKPITLNPLTKLWLTFSMSMMPRKHIAESFKVAELAAIEVLKFVEDEWTSSTISFSKSKLWNRLNEHPLAYVGVYNQEFCTLEDFPFNKVYDEWHVDRRRHLDCHIHSGHFKEPCHFCISLAFSWKIFVIKNLALWRRIVANGSLSFLFFHGVVFVRLLVCYFHKGVSVRGLLDIKVVFRVA